MNSEEKVKISMLKYFWQASPLSLSRNKSLHLFLKKMEMFKDFGDYEIWTLTKYMHQRSYSHNEIIFKEGDFGLAFYIIHSGSVQIYAKKPDDLEEGFVVTKMTRITELNAYDYLGELSLIDTHRKRTATALANGNTVLISIYKSDVDEMIRRHPVVAAKLIQSMASVVARRFVSVTEDLKLAKEKIFRLENSNESKITP